jgi:glycosyltransferase involved in cell wall biosynthesis
MPEEGTQWRRFKIRCKNAVFAAAERYAAARCHRIVSVADAMTSQFLARGIGRAERYATVYSGMEVAQFTSAPAITAARSALGLTPDRFVVGTVARLAEHKGHDDLLLALAPEFKARPELVLLWVGDGWRREALVSRAKAMGLGTAQLDQGERPGPDTQLVLTGLIEPEAVPRHIAAMDVLAHPSYREGLPRTVPQALLAGVCPVAYDVDGTGEICRELETGRLVPLGDLERLAQAICWCIDQPVARRALAARGRAECLERFDARTMVARLEKVYQDAIACSLVR